VWPSRFTAGPGGGRGGGKKTSLDHRASKQKKRPRSWCGPFASPPPEQGQGGDVRRGGGNLGKAAQEKQVVFVFGGIG